MVMAVDQARIRSELRKVLSPGRVRHTLAVAGLASELARRHGEDPEKAELAGLLHDWAKELSASRLAAYSRRYRLAVPQRALVERHSPHLLHGYVSAHMARKRFGIKDRDVLAAISHHTLGSPRMSLLEKIVYVADLGSPDRKFSQAKIVRDLALKDLPAAFRQALGIKIRHVIEHGRWLHPMTVSLWNHIQQHEN